jgi:hypothetical protein
MVRLEGPPEEQFWQRYSPHHEFPLSSVGSVLVYVLAAVLIWAVITLSGIFRAAPPPDMGVVEDGADTPGAPGNPGNPGAPGDPGPKEAVEPATPEEMKNVSVPSLEELPKVTIDPNSLIQDFVIDDKTPVTPEIDSFSKLGKDIQSKLAQGLKGPKGTGAGGENGNNGNNGNSGNIRVKRMARWSLVFNTHGGDDYLVQLASMGAMVGVPTEDPVRFTIYRNLKNPQVSTEDVTTLKQMRWTDDRPDSIGGLCHGLGLPQTPRFIVAFFPETVEKQMKEAEHNYRGLNEDQIAITRFLVVKRGNGYVPVVMDQQALAAGPKR